MIKLFNTSNRKDGDAVVERVHENTVASEIIRINNNRANYTSVNNNSVNLGPKI